MWVSRTHNNVLFMHQNIETIMIEQIFYGCEQKKSMLRSTHFLLMTWNFFSKGQRFFSSWYLRSTLFMKKYNFRWDIVQN